MRNWFVLFLVGTLFLLPFSGSSSAMSMQNMPAQNTMKHHSDSATLVTPETAAEHHMPATKEATNGHCNTEVPMVDMSNQDTQAHHTENHEPQSHHSEVAEVTATDTQTTDADCCDDLSDCGTKCPADCGHCVMFGHGCSAALNSLNLHTPIQAFSSSVLAASFYSLLTSKPTPPPIIA